MRRAALALTVAALASQVRASGNTWIVDAGDGGRAVSLTSGPRARIAGSGATVIPGGDGGFGFLGGCGVMNGGSDSHAGEGLFVGSQSSAVHLAVAVNGGWGWDRGFAAAFQTQSGGVITAADPSAPSLELTTTTPGSTLPLRLRAPAGSVARVWLGRTMLKPAPQSNAVGLMTNRARLIQLGVVPANGVVLTSLLLPGGLDPGDLIVAQADVVTVTGQLLFTNSISFTMPRPLRRRRGAPDCNRWRGSRARSLAARSIEHEPDSVTMSDPAGSECSTYTRASAGRCAGRRIQSCPHTPTP